MGAYSLRKVPVPAFAPKTETQSSLMLLMRESQFFVTSSVQEPVVALMDYEVRSGFLTG